MTLQEFCGFFFPKTNIQILPQKQIKMLNPSLNLFDEGEDFGDVGGVDLNLSKVPPVFRCKAGEVISRVVSEANTFER